MPSATNTNNDHGRNEMTVCTPATKTLAAQFTKRDLMLYALGIGCCNGNNSEDGFGGELRFVYEHHPKFAPFPTFLLALSFTAERPSEGLQSSFGIRPFPPESMINDRGDGSNCGILPKEFFKNQGDMEDIQKLPILHISQSLILHDNIKFHTQLGMIDPPTPVVVQARILSIKPRNIGTFVTSETKYYQGTGASHGDGRGICIATAQMVALILGLDPDSVVPLEASTDNQNEAKSRKAQYQKQESPVLRDSPTSANQLEYKGKTVLQYRTSTNAALLYRLSGDYNPIHVEGDLLSLENGNSGENTQEGGAVLHGLCTMGYAVRAVLRHADHHHTNEHPDVEVGLASVRCNFVKPVYVGDILCVDVWDGKDGARHDETGYDVCFRVYRDVGRAGSGGNPSDTKKRSDVVVDKGKAHFFRRRPEAEGIGNVCRL